MANTLTGLIPVIYEALDIVARERIGFIPAVTVDGAATTAALNQVISSPVAPASTPVVITPGVTSPGTGSQTIGTMNFTLNNSYAAPVQWTGEEQLSVGGIYADIQKKQFIQAFRALGNQVESSIALAVRQNASRAYGTAGTPAFGTANNYADFANLALILDQNGAPATDRHLVLGMPEILNLRSVQSGLFNVSLAGTDQLLRQGTVNQVMGFAIHNSGQVNTTTKGTGASYTTTTAGFPVGTTQIPLITGTGTIVAGDVVTFAGDTNKYVVVSGIAAPGTITIANPGLKQAVAASAVAVTVGNTYAANAAFTSDAVQLVTRAPAMPSGGDSATDVVYVLDPVSGITFQVCMYAQYRQVHMEIGLVWGVGVTKQEFVATLLG